MMETIISPRRIEWMQHILSQLFQHPQANSITGEIQTSKLGRVHRRRNHVPCDNNNNNNNNATLAQKRNTKSSRTALPVAMGNESFSWEPNPTNDLHSVQIYGNEAISLRNLKSKSRGKEQKHSLSMSSSTSSWRVSCLLAFVGLSLITITLSTTGVNPAPNPLSQLRMKMQPTIEDADVSNGTSSLPIETLTMLFLRSTGFSLLVHALLSLILPFQLLQTSKVALLYGMAILAAGQALTNHAIQIPCSGVALVFWFLAGWESWMTWETTNSFPTTGGPSKGKSKSSTILNGFNAFHEMQQQQSLLLVQYLVDDVAQTVFVVTVPLLIATFGMPHMLIEFLLQPSTQQLVQRDEEEWTTTTSTLFLSIRLFGLCQFAFAVLIMDWKDRMRWSLQQQQEQQSRLHQPYNPFLLWLPLFHLMIVNLPLFLSIMMNMEDMMLLGACLVIGQVGIGVWMIFRTVGTLQYTQGHP